MKMKKIVTVLLAALALSVAVPNVTPTAPAQAAAKKKAAIKISKKTATLIEGKTLTLKITGTKKKVSWKSSKKSVATVSSKGKVTAKKAGTATITATVSKKKYTCKVTVKMNEASIKKKLKEIQKWANEEILNGAPKENKGFGAIDSYVINGCFDYKGEKPIDIDEVIDNLGKSLKKLPAYDKFISELKGEKYNSLKTYWKFFVEVINGAYNDVKTNKPKSGYGAGYYLYDTVEMCCDAIYMYIYELIK